MMKKIFLCLGLFALMGADECGTRGGPDKAESFLGEGTVCSWKTEDSTNKEIVCISRGRRLTCLVRGDTVVCAQSTSALEAP